LVLRIAVSGYYGFKNAGDDAILMALVTTIRALAPGSEITVFSNCPAETRQLYGVRAVNRWNPYGVIWALLRSDLLLSGGGGLLQDVTGVRSICYYLVVVLLALTLGKPVVYYAQGVGPVRTRVGRWLTRIVSNHVDLITVRDQASRDDLLAMGVCRPPLVVTADPVLALNPAQLSNGGGAGLLDALRRKVPLENEASGAVVETLLDATPPGGENPPVAQGVQGGMGLARQPASSSDAQTADQAGTAPETGGCAKHRLGIAVRDWPGDDRYKKRIAVVADRFVRDGWEVILIPFHYPADVQPCKEISWLMQEPSLLVDQWLAVGSLFGLLAEMDLVLAMRLHAIVMASVMRTPCVGIAYDPKVERFLDLTGQPNAGSTSSLEEEQLYRVLLDAWERRQELVAHLDKVLAHLRQQAWETASLTLSVFYARSPKKRRELGRAAATKSHPASKSYPGGRGETTGACRTAAGTAGDPARPAGKNRNAKQ
jgi:polysaccharide pyruvyl transferase WcaK-like protein